MHTIIPPVAGRHLWIAILVALLALTSWRHLSAETVIIRSASGDTDAASTSTNVAEPEDPVPAAALALPAKHLELGSESHSDSGRHITIIRDDDEDSPDHKSKSRHEGSSSSSEDEDYVLIPLLGILASFGMPVLIVFFVCYFKYRRRQESLAMAREFLSKGQPVPPELLADSGVSTTPSVNTKSDLSRGFRLTFIGLGITLALYFVDRHSTIWAWGLIPLVMGLGFLVSGWVYQRASYQQKDERAGSHPPGNFPPL